MISRKRTKDPYWGGRFLFIQKMSAQVVLKNFKLKNVFFGI